MDLAIFFKVVGRRWWLTLLCSLIGVAIALVVAMTSPNTYESKTTLMLSSDSDSASSSFSSGSSTALQTLPTVIDLVYSDSVLDPAAEKLGTSAAALRSQISTENNTDSLLFTVSVKSDSPQHAADAVVAISDSLSTVTKASFAAKSETGTDYLSISTVDQPTLSAQKVSPHTSRLALAGLILGAAAGAFISLVLGTSSAPQRSERSAEK